MTDEEYQEWKKREGNELSPQEVLDLFLKTFCEGSNVKPSFERGTYYIDKTIKTEKYTYDFHIRIIENEI